MRKMWNVSVSELLFYGGLIGMGMTMILVILAAVIFRITGKKLKKKLEEEYGKIQDYQ